MSSRSVTERLSRQHITESNSSYGIRCGLSDFDVISRTVTRVEIRRDGVGIVFVHRKRVRIGQSKIGAGGTRAQHRPCLLLIATEIFAPAVPLQRVGKL